MSQRQPPPGQVRRRKELREEMTARARAWLPEWHARDRNADAGSALLDIAARLESEVTQRLDRLAEKTYRGFLSWLGVRGRSGTAARLPVVFTMTAGSEPVLARAPVQLQATEVNPPVTFETEKDVQLVPAKLVSLVAADPINDKFFLPPDEIFRLEPPKALPTEWRLMSVPTPGTASLQLEPALGLEGQPTLLHRSTGLQYRVAKAEGGIVTIEPAFGTREADAADDVGTEDRAGEETLLRVTAFDPFGGTQRNRQEHALFIGSESLFNLDAAADIAVAATGLDGSGYDWSFWGKADGSDELGWRKLEASRKSDRLILHKPAGAFEKRKIGEVTSRWLRAQPTAPLGESATRLSNVRLTVNCDEDRADAGGTSPDAAVGCPRRSGEPRSTVGVEAIANTTAVVLDSTFYPLGREPRLFDAFYLGCPEAFSKADAKVEICFEVADGKTGSHTALLVGDSGNVALFGIGRDGNLYRPQQKVGSLELITRLPPVRPPFTDQGIASIPVAATLLNRNQPRLTGVTRAQGTTLGDDVVVAMTAGNDAWLWRETVNPANSRWFRLGAIFDAGAVPPPVDELQPPSVIVLRDDLDAAGRLRVIGLNQGVLYEAQLRADLTGSADVQWARVTLPDELKTREWVRIAPIFSAQRPLRGASLSDGWIAVDHNGELLLHSKDKLALLDVEPIQPGVVPLAVGLTESQSVLLVVQQSDDEVAAWTIDLSDTKCAKIAKQSATIHGSLDWHEQRTDIAVVFLNTPGNEPARVATWFPLRAQGASPGSSKARLFLSSPIDGLDGAPALLPSHAAVSGMHGELLLIPFDFTPATPRFMANGNLGSIIESGAAGLSIEAGDILAVEKAAIASIDEVLSKGSGRVACRSAALLADTSQATQVDVYREATSAPVEGTAKTKSKITPAAEDKDAAVNGLIRVQGDSTLHSITSAEPPGAATEIAIEPPLAVKGAVKYWHLKSVAPALRINVHPLVDVRAIESVLSAIRSGGIYFDSAEPSLQSVTEVLTSMSSGNEYVALAERWATLPSPDDNDNLQYSLNTIYQPPIVLADAKGANPALSWEYWDGKAWWKIQGLEDRTANFLYSGLVSFCVPAGLQATDVVGRTSHWIRARLVGGDYGRETIVTKSKKSRDRDDPDVIIQTSERDLSGIAAPQIVSLDLRYQVCCPVRPDYIQTLDAAATQDRSGANRSPDMEIEFFVPLRQTIAAAGRRAAAPPSATHETPSPCACAACRGGAESQGAETSAPGPGTTDPALFLGFDDEIKGEPVNLLFLVEERSHDDAAPLRVDVLTRDGFRPIRCEDGTMGLGQSGLIVCTLPEPPQATDMFGVSRYWLRVCPSEKMVDPTKWQPLIRGAWVNAVWATAADTQQLEPLGSSDGSPGQTVRLARTPVVAGSLELRVREPLGDEDVDALRASDPDLVRDPLDSLRTRPGTWVRWTQVGDPADHGPGDRVYALDENSGEITFGDGLHGMIPPIGRDVFIARRYQRGGGAAANGVGAWDQVNLITPLPGVERAVAVDGAAGGADAQSPEATLHFASPNLRLRQRALTLRDLELMALQSSAAIAQVRAVGTAAGARVIVAAKGRDPKPRQAVLRELQGHLMEHAPPSLSARGALQVVAVEAVPARVRVRVMVDALEHSGGVAGEVVARVGRLLDAASGGHDGTGWRFGDVPTDTDVAAVLAGIEFLASVEDVAVERIGVDGGTQALTELLPTQILSLVADGVAVDCILDSEAAA